MAQMSLQSAVGWIVVAIYIILNIVLHATGVNPELTNYVDGGLGLLLGGSGLYGLRNSLKSKGPDDPGVQ